MPRGLTNHAAPSEARRVRLFRNGKNQALRIPIALEFSGTEVLLRPDGNSLVIEPVGGNEKLLAVLRKLKPISDNFPDVDESLSPLDEPSL